MHPTLRQVATQLLSLDALSANLVNGRTRFSKRGGDAVPKGRTVNERRSAQAPGPTRIQGAGGNLRAGFKKYHKGRRGETMSLVTHDAPVSSKKLWAGKIISALPALLLLFSGLMKLLK